MDGPNTTRIVILGKTGTGKSSIGNTIFGEETFEVGHAFNSETQVCKAAAKCVDGREITLIDTPGFFGTDMPEERLKEEIMRCIIECAPGPHAFLIVLKVERVTEQEKEVIQKMCQYFSDEMLKYSTVVFTHGDQLLAGQTIQDFVYQNEFMRDLGRKCGGRCHVIDNRYWNQGPTDQYRSNQFQVRELLKSIDETLRANNGKHYTNELLQAVGDRIQLEMQRIAHSHRNTKADIVEEAKTGVYNMLIRVSGVTTGALLGAFFGLATVAGVAAIISKESISLLVKRVLTALAADAASAAETTSGAAAAATMIKTAAVCAAVTGAVLGGARGYHAAEKAETPLQAVEMAAKDVWESGCDVITEFQNLTRTVFNSQE